MISTSVNPRPLLELKYFTVTSSPGISNAAADGGCGGPSNFCKLPITINSKGRTKSGAGSTARPASVISGVLAYGNLWSSEASVAVPLVPMPQVGSAFIAFSA